jgi:L,D-transpeptidase YcbB
VRRSLDAVLEAAAGLAAERGAIEAALAGLPEAEREAVAGFYEARGFVPYWTADAARGEALVAALREADAHGLPASRYDADGIARLIEAGAPGEAEIVATRAFLAYARAMTGGVVVPSRVDSEINITPERPEDADLLARLAERPAAEAIAALEPSAPEYRALIEERSRLEAVAATGAWGETVPEGAALRRATAARGSRRCARGSRHSAIRPRQARSLRASMGACTTRSRPSRRTRG